MKNATRLKDSDSERAIRASTEAKAADDDAKKARVFDRLSAKEKDDLLKEIAIRMGLVKE